MKNAQEKLYIQTKRGRYQVLIWHDKRDKAYLVKVPSLPEVVTFGVDMQDAKRMAKDAIELYCDCVVSEGKIVIDDEDAVIGTVPKTARVLIPVR